MNVEAMVAATPRDVEVVRCYPGEMRLCDCYVLHNIKHFNQGELKMAVSQPYVKVSHDHWDTPQAWQRDWIGPVMNRARAVIFLSPLHRESYLRQHPEVRPQKVYLVPSPIDPAPFEGLSEGASRQGTCWLGEFQPHKGVEAACRWARENGTVDFYGWGPFPPCGDNVRLMGQAAYADIPGTMARYEQFLFLPEGVEAFGRTVAEARLAGCVLVVNEKVGALSWGWETREEWARGVGGAAARFWEIVLGVLGDA